MRPEFMEPGGGIDVLSDEDLHCVLLLAGADVAAAAITPWTSLERLLAYDWAMREHLRASDCPVRARPCPHFVIKAAREGGR